jgi:hypothetical protein
LVLVEMVQLILPQVITKQMVQILFFQQSRQLAVVKQVQHLAQAQVLQLEVQAVVLVMMQ